MLPVKSLPRADVVIDADEGPVTVPVRGLTRAEMLKAQPLVASGDQDGMDNFFLSCGTDTPEDEARAWRESTDAATVGLLVDAIVALSAGTKMDGKDPLGSTSKA